MWANESHVRLAISKPGDFLCVVTRRSGNDQTHPFLWGELAVVLWQRPGGRLGHLDARLIRSTSQHCLNGRDARLEGGDLQCTQCDGSELREQPGLSSRIEIRVGG